MWTRTKLKSNARIVLSQNYWKAVLIGFIALLTMVGSNFNITNTIRNHLEGVERGLAFIALVIAIFMLVVVSLLVSIALQIFLAGPLEVSCKRLFISCRAGQGDLSQLTFAFKNSYLNIAGIQFLRLVFILLWTLLLVIPGIMKSYEYRMVPYILAENPELSMREVFARSRVMMMGEKLNTFVLDLSFLGWYIVGLLTLNILNIFYVIPYHLLTETELYEVLKGKLDCFVASSSQ